MSVYSRAKDFLSTATKAQNLATTLWQKIGGTEIGGVLKLPEGKASHWKDLLTNTIDDLTSSEAERRLVFFWDEFPYMISNICQRQGELVAMEILDILRSLRQSKPAFRMVLTGSIGLHHVLWTLHAKGYANEPFNDMTVVEVPPFTAPDAQALARELMAGEGLTAVDANQVANQVASEADCFPFYIHSIVRHLKYNHANVTVESVTHAVHTQLASATDPWELAHFRTRIRSYYPSDEDKVQVILDVLCHTDASMSVDAILNSVHSQMAAITRTQLLELLRLLDRDHYLIRTVDGQYRFRFSLVRRWWKLDRGL